MMLSITNSPLLVIGVRPRPELQNLVEGGPLYPFFFLFFLVCASYGLFWIGRTYLSSSGVTRAQLKYLLFGSIIGYTGGANNFLLVFDVRLPFLSPYGTYAIPIYVLIASYAILRYRFMDVNLAITRATVFMVVYFLVLGLPLIVVTWWQPPIERILGQDWWVWLWVACSILATAAHYANLYFQQRAENRILAEQRRYQASLRQASQGMTRIKELDRLLRLLVHYLTHRVPLKHASIYLWDKQTEKFSLRSTRQKPKGPTPTFGADDPLTKYIYDDRKAIVTEELALAARSDKPELYPIIEALKSIDASVLVPSFVEDNCLGFLVLGEKVSEALYTQDDLDVFQVLANQAALAIENAQFYEELKHTQADLFQTAKMASLGHMAGGMSHQINNRFHVLTILAGTLKSTLKLMDPTTMSPDKLKEFWDRSVETLTKVEENALRGGDIVKTLLKFSRPAGEYKSVEVQQIINTAKEVVQFRVNPGLFDIIEDIPEDLPPVKGDLNQLADCLINLISNAFDATQKKAELIQDKRMLPGPEDAVPYKGQIAIRASFSESFDGKSWVLLGIRDNGTGISKDELQQLFVPFFTTKATTEKGTGLGLYIIQRIVEQHGGVIKANSHYGHGTTFSIQLPAAID